MFLRKNEKFEKTKTYAQGKCYKIKVKNRGENVILEIVKPLKNKGYEFPRTHVYKRRVLEMKRHTQHKAVLSVIMTAVIGMAGVVTTFAYDSPNTVSGPVDHDVGGDANFIMESAEAGNTELPSDHFFTDDSGLVYDISSPDINNRTICFHDFSIHGTWNNHKKDGKGGCVVKSYDAFLCSKCSDVKVVKLKSTATFNPCPH